MYRRVTSVATSAAVGLAAAVALMPASAQAAPETFTGRVQVIVGDTIIGCASTQIQAYGDLPGISQSTDGALRVSVSAGTQQQMAIEGRDGSVLGVDDSAAAYPMTGTDPQYTFLSMQEPLAAGSPSVARRQSAIWSVDPATMDLSATYVRDDLTVLDMTAHTFGHEYFISLTPNFAAVANGFPMARQATLRLGETCSGLVQVDEAQAITFTSAAPSPAYPGQTYTVAATGGASENAVSFSSATSDVCSVDGTTVTFDAVGTCTIDANQAAATGYSAAPTVSQDIAVSAIASSVALDLADAAVVTGQTTTAQATVDVIAGTVAAAGGSVQFAVDGADVGAPVAVDSDGLASSPELGAGVGSHQVTATYVPASAHHLGSTSSASLTVTAANTTTKLSVKPTELSATVAPVAPGAGTPTGDVTFRVDGTKVGTAALADGIAKLDFTVPTDTAHGVSAEYTGSTDFNASSASTSRSNPTITSHVSSAQKSRGGWYRTPVTVSFTCDTKGAELATACPKPVTVSRQGASRVSRTIHTADGGVATVTASVKLDRSAPSVGVKGVKPGHSYFDAPTPKCSAKDSLSGVKTCKVTTQRRGSKVVVTAKATDVAGNVRSKRISYRLAAYTIQGAKRKNGVFQVRHGETYTIRVRGSKAKYVYATPAPGKPHRGSVPFKKAGKNTWALGVTMSMTTSATRSWNLGYTQHGKLHVIKVKVIG
ncbi:Ig-like domain repeat protein [Aeromicrobium sp. Marseille-Q0843]|uniref:Ig-like domain repeat protein n=1 Tax=Aeromicrobium phoceense TaxID=2754045 RepID=A0A838XCK0_9ACTN|nr:Ig-like domain-containing protein [Aeromicrobium phoceense]MBA4607642.1 Ig-like domain repeat protein [Aeromicrobium phoceense]